MLTKGKFLVSFEVPGHTKDYTEGFTEEMIIPYRTEELNPYLRYPNQEINKNHLHSEHIRLRLREILQINLSHNRYNPTTMNITYLKVILSLITILILIHNENTYQSPPTNKIRYLISQILILIIYTTLMILIQRYL